MTIDLSILMAEIRDRLADGGDWCSLEKAQALAALVVGIRPRVICEIGVWMGGSLVPMALALRSLRELDAASGRAPVTRLAIAIDAWSPAASCDGQGETDAAWWRSVDHDAAHRALLSRLERHGLRELCEVVRAPSDEAPVPVEIDLLHVDGNHAGQALRDIERFAPSVRIGGVLVLDDVSWYGGHVARGRDAAKELGFRELHSLGTGVVMQRVENRRT